MRSVWVSGVLAAHLALACGDGSDADLAREAERVRELPLLEDVAIRTLSRDAFHAANEAAVAAISDERLRGYADSYGRLGFFPMDRDLRPVLVASSDFAGASYSWADKEITLIGDPGDQAVVHEYVHALQDHHFDLAAFVPAMTSDALLAHQAIVEGDATLAQLRFAALQEGFDLPELPSWQRAFDFYRARSGSLVADGATLFFSAYPSFAYAYGLEYCVFNLTGATYATPSGSGLASHDWTREDDLFRGAAPATTRDVLDLTRNEPVDVVGLDATPPELAAAFETIDWDSLGEWLVFLLLVPADECAGACPATRALAARWNGDRALFVRDRATQATGVVWASSWDDGRSAAEIAALLAELHGFVPDAAAPPLGRSRDGETMLLDVRGTRVVLVKNVTAEAAASFADAAFAPPSAPKPAPRARPSPLVVF